jgi:hypothetical protein
MRRAKPKKKPYLQSNGISQRILCFLQAVD